MRKYGTITYELSEEEYNSIKSAILDIEYYLDNDVYKDDAERGLEILKDIFND